MTPEQWNLLKTLFEAALDLPEAARPSFIARACDGDDRLRSRLEALLSEHRKTQGPLDGNAFDFLSPDSFYTHALEAGAILVDRFRVVRFIAQGGMGEVYEVEDLQLKQRFALKTIRSDVARSAHMLERFKREINAARKISNRHVCRVNEFVPLPDDGQGNVSAFLTMDLLDGPTLSRVIREQGPLPPEEARSIALQLCDALQAAHNEKVIHRDFKCANIILTSSSDGGKRAVVTDFGLARDLEAATSPAGESAITLPGSVIGTPAYMAPEQFDGRPATPATDLYALGVVLYEMVTGRQPFSGETPLAAAVQRAKRPPSASSIRPGLDRRWDRVTARCLEYEPSRRFQSAGEVAAALGESSSAVAQLKRSVTRAGSRRILGPAALALLALVVAGAWYWFGRGYVPPSAEARRWYEEGASALREGTYLKATRALEHALALDGNFILAHARLSDAWTELDFAAKAKDEMLLASSPDSIRRLPRLDRLYLEAVRSTVTRDFAAAIERYKEILNALPQNARPEGYVDLGRAYEKAGNISEAARNYSAASKLAAEYPASFVRLGILESRQRHADAAGAAFAQAEKLYRAASNVEGQAEIAYQRGYAASTQGQLAAARAFLEKSLQAARTIPSVQLQIRALLQLSTVESLSGGAAKSLELSGQAIQLARADGLEYWAVDGSIRQASAFLNGGDLDKSEAYLFEARQAAQKNGWPRLEAKANLTLASLRNKEERPREAIPLAAAAQKYYAPAGFFMEDTQALLLAARAKRDLDDLPGALESGTAALAAAQKSGSPILLMQAQELAGTVLLALERYPEALDRFQAALKTSREIGLAVEYQALHCADTLWRLGRSVEARQNLDLVPAAGRSSPGLMIQRGLVQTRIELSERNFVAALRLARLTLGLKTNTSGTQVALKIAAAEAERQLGSVSEAARNGESAMAVAERESDPVLINDAKLELATLLCRSGAIEKARLLAEAAQVYFESLGRAESEWRSLWWLSRIYRKSGNSASAEKSRAKALDILHTFEHNWGSQAFQLYVARGDVREAWRELQSVGR